MPTETATQAAAPATFTVVDRDLLDVEVLGEVVRVQVVRLDGTRPTGYWRWLGEREYLGRTRAEVVAALSPRAAAVASQERVSVPDPVDPHGWPIFEGSLTDAGRVLIPGRYDARAGAEERPVMLFVNDAGDATLFEADEQPDHDENGPA